INHAEAVAHHGDLARGIVVPTHRDFAQAQAREMGQVDQLHVETEPIDLSGFNQWTANAHAECFKSALCIPERQPGSQPHNQIENSSSLFATPWLMHAYQAAIERSR